MFSLSGSVACFFHSGVPRRQCARDDFHAEKLSCCQPKLSDGNAWKIRIWLKFSVFIIPSVLTIFPTLKCVSKLWQWPCCVLQTAVDSAALLTPHMLMMFGYKLREGLLYFHWSHSVFSEDQLKGQMQVLVRSWSFLLYLNMTFRYYSFAVDSFLGTSLLLSSACFKDAAHHANLCQSFGS